MDFKIIDEKASIIDDTIESSLTAYKKDVKGIEQILLNELFKLLAGLKYNQDGTLSNENNLPAMMAEFDKIAEKVSASPTFVNDVSKFLTDLTKVKTTVAELHDEANNIKILSDKSLLAKLTTEEKWLADKTVYDLGQGGMKWYFTDYAKRLSLEAVVMGYSQKELQRRFEAMLMSNSEKDGYYMRYSVQITRDTATSYAGQIHQIVADQYELDGIRYVGGLVDDSRPFCTHVKKTLNGVINRKALPKLLKQYQGTSGMKPNTTEDNFYIVRGGFNCPHQGIPFRI